MKHRLVGLLLCSLVMMLPACGSEEEAPEPAHIPSPEESLEKARADIDSSNADAELEKLRQEIEADQ